MVEALALPALPPPCGNVRVRSGLAFRLPVPAPDWPDEGGRAALGFNDRDESRDRDSGYRIDVVDGGSSLSVRTNPDHAYGGFGWRLAILRPAPIREYALV